MNSKKYFNEHFQDVIKRSDKNGQTIFFCNLALDNLPKWLVSEIKKGLSIADVGCAMGECVNILQNKFKNSKVTGVDFSPVAIKGAKIKFPDNIFLCGNLDSLKKRYDIIFCSNTLEHFHNPLNKLKKISEYSDKYIVLLLPFQEYERTLSHFYTFDFDNIPFELNDFNIAFVKIFSTWKMENNHWPGTPKSPGKQILLVYAKKNFPVFKKISLDSLVPENIITDDMFLKLEEINHKLNKIHQSNFWKLVLNYYKLRDFIFRKI